MKDNFKILNNVDIDLDKYTDLKIDNKEKLKADLRLKIKSNKKSRKGLIAVASLGVISLSVIGAGVVNPSLADSLPAVQKIFVDLNKKLNLGYDTIKDAQDIKLSTTVNDITISIEDAVSDGNSLYITYTINSKDKPLLDKANNTYYSHVTEIEASDDISLAGQSFRVQENGEVKDEDSNGYYKDDYTFVGFKKYSIISENSIPDEFDVNMKIPDFYNKNNEEDVIEGPWEFDFKVSKNIEATRININQATGEYKVNYIDKTPFTLKLNLEFPEDFAAKDNKELKRVEIEDDKGQIIFRANYKQGEIGINNHPNWETSSLENRIITTDITHKMDYYVGSEQPEYIVIKFVDYKNIIENGQVVAHEKIEETKDIEFKVNLDI